MRIDRLTVRTALLLALAIVVPDMLRAPASATAAEECAFEYLRKLHPNVQTYTQSGTAPSRAAASGPTVRGAGRGCPSGTAMTVRSGDANA